MREFRECWCITREISTLWPFSKGKRPKGASGFPANGSRSGCLECDMKGFCSGLFSCEFSGDNDPSLGGYKGKTLVDCLQWYTFLRVQKAKLSFYVPQAFSVFFFFVSWWDMVKFLEMFVARDVFLLQTLFTSRYDDDFRCSHRFDDEEEEEGEEDDDRGDSSRNCVVLLFTTSTRKSLSPKKLAGDVRLGLPTRPKPVDPVRRCWNEERFRTSESSKSQGRCENKSFLFGCLLMGWTWFSDGLLEKCLQIKSERFQKKRWFW